MKVISVKFKESGRAYYFDPKELEIKEGGICDCGDGPRRGMRRGRAQRT